MEVAQIQNKIWPVLPIFVAYNELLT